MDDLVNNIIKFNAQTNGRDKLCRLFQYGCRLAWGRLQQTDKKDLLTTLKNIESMLSMTRKLLRFGRSLDFIQGALKSIHLKDGVLRLTLTLSKINQAFYLLFDHFLWFHNVGAVKLDKQYWSDVSSRFYLATLLLNLSRDFYGIYQVIEEELALGESRGNSSGAYQNGEASPRTSRQRKVNVLDVLHQNIPLIMDTIKNLFDLAIPMSALQMVHLSPQKQGLFGIISSFLALLVVWNPTLKLVPS
ncbi:peroxisomal membrane protein 11B-like [Dreissena polymorpha]|uniref:Peroxisomal membrane protein 11B n=1 Tax=Dreissena polymorpha TaxID=45954 RepID=A0A9D4K9Q9_DREPO|nr:peroxisomal membrane protein 11B-like [Dreissena polymorpha]KAH3835611.1 hypothetical protein DPMN_108966 [Dreissena polymorpha]